MEREAPGVLLTVGLVARRSGLTAKALRHYDRIGLLRPARVDDATGYRLYRSDQVAEARLVGLLRSLDLPLDQVRTAVLAWKSGRRYRCRARDPSAQEPSGRPGHTAARRFAPDRSPTGGRTRNCHV